MRPNLLSAEDKLTLFEDLREIRNVIGRVAGNNLVCDFQKTFQQEWSLRPDICLATNEGYYNGRDAVSTYYSSLTERAMAIGKMIQARFPEKLAALKAEEIYGRGELNFRSADSYVIEVAGDRETAKGLWTVRGSEARLTEGGPQAFWEWGWFAVDFIREDGQWRIWHMQELQEIKRPSGQKWSGTYAAYQALPEYAAVSDLKPAEPTHKCCVRPRYSAERPFTPAPRVPEPYEHFVDTFSYGIPE